MSPSRIPSSESPTSSSPTTSSASLQSRRRRSASTRSRPTSPRSSTRTRSRARGSNSRVKDLLDIALLAGVREIDGAHLRGALEQTFSSRKTHALPTALPEPPGSWAAVYARMVIEDELRWPDITALVKAIETFLNPALAGDVSTWRPTEWSWR
jgi:hypothetical protein